MKELSHADLERFHYREVRTNPQYAIEGMMDIRLEELSMNTLPNDEIKTIIKQPEPWTINQWDVINQLRAEVKHIHNEVHEKKVKPKSNKYEYY